MYGHPTSPFGTGDTTNHTIAANVRGENVCSCTFLEPDTLRVTESSTGLAHGIAWSKMDMYNISN